MSATLLERLRVRSGARTTSSLRYDRLPPGTSAVQASILHNLQRLLNSRQGQSEACPEYGLMDVSQILFGLPESEDVIERAIQRSIERYEPRLKRVKVKLCDEVSGPLSVTFSITACVATEDDDEDVEFETEVGPSGQVRVKNR